jgi:hypothetical protein
VAATAASPKQLRLLSRGLKSWYAVGFGTLTVQCSAVWWQSDSWPQAERCFCKLQARLWIGMNYSTRTVGARS